MGEQLSEPRDAADDAGKPSYLGLLNAIAVAEANAERYLSVWADTTDDDAVASTLRFVALREGEHAQSFGQRISELGFELRVPTNTASFDAQLDVASADIVDAEKFERLGLGAAVTDSDVFDAMFTDKNIDIETGTLLGRYIAEERDSGRRLRECYLSLTAASPSETSPDNGPCDKPDRNETGAEPKVKTKKSKPKKAKSKGKKLKTGHKAKKNKK